MQAVVHAGPLFWNTPIESQRRGCIPLVPPHFKAPGLQSVQFPFRHAAVQAVLSFQAPVASQVWGIFPLHCSDPGLQTPVQFPAEQTKGQTAPLLAQWPPESQTWG
jgi:hypothetical protein